MKSLLPYYLYHATVAFAAVCGLYRFRVLDQATKILSILVAVDCVFEIAAFYVGIKYHSNFPLYAVHGIIEYVLVCLYFNYSIDTFIKKKTGYYLAGLGAIAGLANILFLQGLNHFQSYFLVFEGATIIAMSLFALFRLLSDHDNLRLYLYHHFWFTTILFFFWSITFFNWILYDYVSVSFKEKAWILNLSILIVNIITYISISCVFILYPKMQKG